MPKYQVTANVNSLTVNTDLQCNSKDDVLSFYNALSVAEILNIKRYVFVNPIKIKRVDTTKYKYATVQMTFSNRLPIKIKIPKLKNNKSEADIMYYFKSIYRNIETIKVSISS